MRHSRCGWGCAGVFLAERSGAQYTLVPANRGAFGFFGKSSVHAERRGGGVGLGCSSRW